MALTVSDLQDLIRLLDEHPDWKAELRRRLIDDEWAELRNDIRALVAATQAHDKRLDDIDERLRQLAESSASLVTAMEAANTRANRHESRLGRLDGRMLEMHFREHIHAYLGAKLRRIRLETLDSVPGLLDAYDAGRITQLQWRSLARLDAIVSGVPHDQRDRQIYVALEVSATIDDHDIERAVAGANLLRSLGYDSVAAVGGESIRDDARPIADAEGVVVLVGDEIESWPATA